MKTQQYSLRVTSVTLSQQKIYTHASRLAKWCKDCINVTDAEAYFAFADIVQPQIKNRIFKTALEICKP